MTRPGELRVLWVAVVAVVPRPALWATALRQARRLAPRRWWRRAPFLPMPDAAWVGFRLQTMYGSADAQVEPGEIRRWLAWCRQLERLGR